MVLKVAFVSAFPQAAENIAGGVEGVSQSLAQALHGLGDVEIHVVAPCAGREANTESRNGILIHWLEDSKLPGFIGYWTTFRRSVQNCLSTISPDITHFQGVAGWMLGYRGSSVLTVHGIPERDVLYTDKVLPSIRHLTVAFIERAGRKWAKNVIVINPYVIETLRGQIVGQTWHIENPVNKDFFEVTRNPVAKRILYVGRISRLKNVLGLIRAFAVVHRQVPDATLHVAGTADNARYYSECAQEVARQGLGSAVRFLGNADRRSLVIELSQAECVALVSLQENAPMIISEAMAAGVPVVASNRCGIPYMVEDGGTGYLVDPTDTRDIADRLLTILKNPELGATMSRRSREAALKRFHADSVAVRTQEVYRAVLGGKSPAR